MKLSQITVTILTKNSEKYLHSCLNSVKDFGEVLILDNGSTDQTQCIAKEFSNVNWQEHPFKGFGFMKNLAAERSKNSWILNLDSDEMLSPKLIEELKKIDSVDNQKVISFSRKNHFKKRWIKACGWHPDRVYRLYNKNHTQFSNDSVHEKLQFKPEQHLPLNSEIIHFTFDSVEELVQKMNMYSSLYAFDNEKTKQGGVAKAIIRSLLTFFKNYLFKNGWRYGFDGFIISVCNAGGVFFKYVKLKELQRRLK